MASAAVRDPGKWGGLCFPIARAIDAGHVDCLVLGMSQVHKILVPVDGSPSSIAGLSKAVAWASDLDASIEVLHVDAPDEFQVGSATQVSAAARAQAARATEIAVENASRVLGDRVERRAIDGEPLRRILEIAREDQVDLIVMGTHGRVGRLHSLIGSVAEGVVRNAPCPVMTVRAPDGDAEAFAERIHGREGIATQTRSR